MSRVPLTDLAIRGLAAEPGGRVEMWDSKVPGLGVRASDRGTKTFVLMYRLAGVKRRLSLGRYPTTTLAEARDKAWEIVRTVAKGIDPEPKVAVKNDDGFARLVGMFVEQHCRQHNRANTARETQRILVRRFVAAWGDRSIAEISHTDVRTVLGTIVATGRASSANHALSAVRKFFNWCVEQSLLEGSPCATVRRPAPLSSRERVLSDTELLAVWRATHEIDPTFASIVRLLILTAQRRGEVTGMRWPEVNAKDGLWTIPGDRTKNKSTHILPLSGGTLATVLAVPRMHDELVFPARGNDDTTFSGFSKLKRHLDRLSGVRAFTLHDLRRTAATGMARLGVAPHVVERVLNHTSGTFGGVAGIYNRFAYLPEMRAALTVWSDHVFNLDSAKL